ncbi:MAG: pyruvate dehydrogenase complex E1 component subunit beta [Eubacteriales bacterium]|nr:pyruvate dehydrogenase complex E1 component subunit beta [Eubacteriales bacterium]
MPWTKITQSDYFEIDDNTEAPTSRRLKYTEAVREALDSALEIDKRVFVMGQGINDPGGMFGATTGLYKKYGEERVFETPLAEAGLTGIAVGAAAAGLRPFYCHNRPDFLMLAMDQIVNHATKLNYMSGGQCNVPLVVWATTGMGWGSAAQHSQALHGLFMHVPGLKIIMPTTPYDVKGLILSAIEDNNPVMIFEHRKLFNQTGHVPEQAYKIPIGKGVVRKTGTDITVVAISEMVAEALKASKKLEEEGISLEIIDLRTIKPFDEDIIINSIKKTGRLLIADTGWATGGVSAEIAARIGEKTFGLLKAPIVRLASEDVPTPASYVLERAFYKNAEDLEKAAKALW